MWLNCDSFLTPRNVTEIVKILVFHQSNRTYLIFFYTVYLYLSSLGGLLIQINNVKIVRYKVTIFLIN
jgi:hypothetical protein